MPAAVTAAVAAGGVALASIPARPGDAKTLPGGKRLLISTFEGTPVTGQLATVTCSKAAGRPADPNFFVQ